MTKKQKLLLVCLALSLFIQIAFSFYYNSQIIDQNHLLQQQQQTHKKLFTRNQTLTFQLTKLSSLKHLFPLIKSKNLQPVNKTFFLPKN